MDTRFEMYKKTLNSLGEKRLVFVDSRSGSESIGIYTTPSFL